MTDQQFVDTQRKIIVFCLLLSKIHLCIVMMIQLIRLASHQPHLMLCVRWPASFTLLGIKQKPSFKKKRNGKVLSLLNIYPL